MKSYQELREIFSKLAWEWHYADQAHNTARKAELRQQLDQCEAAIWQSTTTFFPELAPYESCAEAMEQIARQCHVPFPDLTDPQHRTDHLGKRRFRVDNDRRGIWIWPWVATTTYDVVLFDYVDYYIDRGNGEYDMGVCYRGETNELISALNACSLWYMTDNSIATVYEEFSWISHQPIELDWN